MKGGFLKLMDNELGSCTSGAQAKTMTQLVSLRKELKFILIRILV